MYDILGAHFIDDYQSEPYYQYQNHAERQIQTSKRGINILLDRIRAPVYA